MNEIVISSSQFGTRRWVLDHGEYLVGRDSDAEIPVEDTSVSWHHARIMLGEREIWIEDLGSANGSFVDETPIEGMARIEAGQSARLGDASITIRRLPASTWMGSGPTYEMGVRVAAGGMGAIHQARQCAMGREVAMKVMLKEGSDRATQRFIHEARITGRLEHPNIVPVHELGADDAGRVFYTMKLVRGKTLSSVLAELASRPRIIPPSHLLSSLLTVFQKVCDAVAFAHSCGVIHRDLKPDNIMIGDFGEVLVMDWGLAKDLREAEEAPETPGALPNGGAGSTMDGSVLGTPAYMSPEQARGEIREMDARSDIYALGAILHEILYLRPVVSGANPMEIVRKVAHGEGDKIGIFTSKHLPSGKVPVSLRAIRRKALAFRPEERYPTVGDLQADISAYQAGFATGAESAGISTHLALFVKRHRGVTSSIGAAAALLVGLSIWFTTHLVRERNQAHLARIEADRSRVEAEQALAWVEPARLEATAQRDRATAALAEAQAQRALASEERDRAVQALAETDAIRQRASDALMEMRNAGEIFSKLSVEYVRSGRVNEALENIDRALQVAPQNNQYRVARANLLQASGRFSQAIPEYRRALAQRPNPTVARNLALTEKLAEELGDTQEFTDDIRRQLEEALHAQNRALEAILMPQDNLSANDDSPLLTQPLPDADAGPDAPDADEPELTEDPAIIALLEKLTEYTIQPGWTPNRLRRLGDGTFHLDLSRLNYSGLQNIRGESISELNLRSTNLTDLSDLQGWPLQWLDIGYNSYTDLSPIADMPLRHLSFSRHTRGIPLQDYSPIGTLTELETLSMPAELHGVDFSRHTKLRSVYNLRFMHGQWMPAQDFLALYNRSEIAWQTWGARLMAMNVNGMRPDRVTVINTIGFDLDLNGTHITDLRPLSGMPIHRLYLDTQKHDLDLAPLANMPTLRHLVIGNSTIQQIRACFPGTQLESITLNRHVIASEIPLLLRHPTLQHIGYVFSHSTRLPTTTRDEFFQARDESDSASPTAGLVPLLEYRFDDPTEETLGWTMVTDAGQKSPGVWGGDPLKHQGRGGGHLMFQSPHRNITPTYFETPAIFQGDKSALYGGCFEFQMRTSPHTNRFENSDVILTSGNFSLHYQLKHLPVAWWNTCVVPLHEAAGWHIAAHDGPAATREDMLRVLSNLDAVRIRARFMTSGNPWTYLDEFRVWSARDAPQIIRLANQAEQQFMDSIDWGKSLEITSAGTSNFNVMLQLPYHLVNRHAWVKTFAERDGLLMVHPVSRDQPATIGINVDHPVEEGTILKFGAHGSDRRPGLTLRVIHDGVPQVVTQLEQGWKDIKVPLPPSALLSNRYIIEIHANSWVSEYCFISKISVVKPRDPVPTSTQIPQ